LNFNTGSPQIFTEKAWWGVQLCDLSLAQGNLRCHLASYETTLVVNETLLTDGRMTHLYQLVDQIMVTGRPIHFVGVLPSTDGYSDNHG